MINAYGNRLIELLQYNNLYILNGRTNGDYEGLSTCKNTSSVDYFICSSNLFSHVESLNVIEHCPLYSDVHSPINMNLKCNSFDQDNTNQSKNTLRLWDRNKMNDFLQNLDMPLINKINGDLDQIIANALPASPDNINKLVTDISEVFKGSAEKSFGYRANSTSQKTDENKRN